MKMKHKDIRTAALLRAWARAIYFARQSAETHLLHERLDQVETEMLAYANKLDLEECLTEVEE